MLIYLLGFRLGIGNQSEVRCIFQPEVPEEVIVNLKLPSGPNDELPFFFVVLTKEKKPKHIIFSNKYRAIKMKGRDLVSIVLTIDLKKEVRVKHDPLSIGENTNVGELRRGFFLREPGSYMVSFFQVTKDNKVLSTAYPKLKVFVAADSDRKVTSIGCSTESAKIDVKQESPKSKKE